MATRKIPMRKDVLTNQMFPKRELVRIVRDKEGTISIDPTGKKSGRGAYVGLDPDAIKEAKSKKTLEKVFSHAVPEDFYDELFDFVDHQKARMDLFGDLGKKH
ncbi:RNase P modulator RnpM [Companilactobacillus jidongensis]|uniref:RNase P modulator RnpM n=1 Tax=Companilactobacillus jidongensis TaxID=2486006 RepID=UPI0013DDCDC7|nr:YlxR family protein [Companilactobacillus jidongensis]